MRLLLVEDNSDFRKFLKTRLEEKCFAVDAVEGGDEGLALAKKNSYDLIILDYSLPEKNGYEICTELRTARVTTPIIMISGTGDVLHKVDGFNIGLDDYMVKPFFFEELVARINALLRRPEAQQSSIISFDDLVLDSVKQQVTRAGLPVYLTKKEFALLEYLLRRSSAVVTRGEILDHVWDDRAGATSNTLETHIMNLRRKIDRPRKRKLIHSVPGRGYKLDFSR